MSNFSILLLRQSQSCKELLFKSEIVKVFFVAIAMFFNYLKFSSIKFAVRNKLSVVNFTNETLDDEREREKRKYYRHYNSRAKSQNIIIIS